MNTNRWLLTQYGHYWEEDVLHVYTTTDIPCHSYLRWTNKEEHVHLRMETDRGLKKLATPDYCFTEWNEIEQNEPGDTLEHSFTFPGWYYCLWRWWYFRATIEGEDTPSNTAIFKAHGFDQEEAFTMRHPDLTDKELAGIIDHADGSVTPGKLSQPFTFPTFPFTPAQAPVQNYEVANKKYVDDQILGVTPIIWLDESINLVTFNGITSTIPWTDIDLSPHIPASATIALLQLHLMVHDHPNPGYAYLQVRKDNTTPAVSPLLYTDEGATLNKWHTEFCICGLSPSKRIEYRVPIGTSWIVTGSIDLLGYS